MKTGSRNLLRMSVGGLLIALSGSAAVAQTKDPIKVGFATALSGWLAAYDEEPHKAAILKIEEINKAGGLLGRQIEYKVMDTKTDLTVAKACGERTKQAWVWPGSGASAM